MSIFKDCDIRGIFGRELFREDAYHIGRALATKCPGKILLGGDCRVSTPELKDALMQGLIESGAHVIDLGTIPTPALYYALRHIDCDAGATVTASHNPPEYNGVKFMIGDKPVTRPVIDALHDIIAEESYATGIGSSESIDILGEYADSMRRLRPSGKIRVLVDAGNGAMSTVAPNAMRNAGCEIVELFCTPDGTFPNRDPNPSDFTHLTNTCEAVRESHVDFGVAFDGDGDRAVFIDETGTPVQNEKALVMFIRRLLAKRPTPVVYDQKSSSVIREAILAMGGTPLPERSGHAFIKRRFLENGAAVAGEVSGHFFFGELGYDDGLHAAMVMANILSESKQTLSSLAGEIVCPPITPDIRFFCPYCEQADRLAAAEAMAKNDGAEISRLDGIRADYENGWFLMRSSVTAEQITLRAEARTKEDLRALLERIGSVLPEEDRARLHTIDI